MPRRYRIPLAGAALLALLAAFATPAQGQSDAAGPDQAVAYQIGIGHDGFSGDTTIKPPLLSRWTHQFTGPVSYPLIAGGKVYVTVADNGFNFGTHLYALDEASGAIVWSQPIDGTFFWSNAAYDDGHLFVVNADGLLREFDASTGAPGWSVELSESTFSSAPTADNGIVYTGGSTLLFAVSETDGSVLWTQPVLNGNNSSPALTATNVYVSYDCGLVYAFDRTTGQQQWFSDGPCEGGGGTTPVYHDGKIYARDAMVGNKILDADTGAPRGTFDARPAPAFAGKIGLFLDASSTLRAVSGNKTLWTFRGDGLLITAPIVVGDTAYIGSTSGIVYGLNVESGEVTWSAQAGATISGPNEGGPSQPTTGLGAGQGLLVVPAGNELAAYSD